jgi:hypothetical protein
MQLTRRQALALAPTLTLLSCTSDKNNKTMNGITEQAWGALPSGETISLFTLRNEKGVETTISSYAAVLSLSKFPTAMANLPTLFWATTRLRLTRKRIRFSAP